MTATAKMALSAKDATGKRQEIILQTQPAANIPGFILHNSLCRECGKPAAPLMPDGFDRCRHDPPGRYPVVQADEAKGKKLAICGAGPSLNKARKFLDKFEGEVWGANRALIYLHEWGYTQAKGIAIDASVSMFGEVWRHPPKTEYLLATSVNPGLVWWLEQRGLPIRYFHSIRGAVGEAQLYGALYPETVVAGMGLNVVNRAVDVAEHMGFAEIVLVGADNALGKNDVMYADGGQAPDRDDVILEGLLDGRRWRTRTDMLMSAVELARKKRDIRKGTKLSFLGDTLPRALQHKPEAFLRRVIDWKNRDKLPTRESMNARAL